MAELEKLMNPPMVSIIIATFNRANFIGKAIESVLDQTYPNFELIIIDDGSTDGTANVVARYQDSRITYRWIENGERSRARNLGIKLSRGKYIAFLDSDDWYLPNKLADQVAALEVDPDAGLVLGGWLILDESGRKIQEVSPWEWISPQPTIEQWLFSTTATPITVLVKKEWIERVGGFDPELFIAEDVELWIRLALAGCSVIWTRQSVAVVLIHGTNSLRNWLHVKNGLVDTLDKMFSYPNFRRKLKMSQEEVYSRFRLTLAWQAYESGLLEQGKQELVRAIELYPGPGEHNNDAILKSIIDHSQYFLVNDPIAFVKQVFQNLPTDLVHLEQYRRVALNKVWLSKAWRVYKDGELSIIRHSLIYAIWYEPKCLKDRGIISMLIQSIVGQRLWHFAKPILHRVKRRGQNNER